MRNSWVVITGASRGLGANLTNHFWNAGWNIALVSRDECALSRTIAQLIDRPEQSALAFKCDLSKPIEVNQLVEKLSNQLPHLDALINNAAIHGPIGPFLENDPILWAEAIQVNLLAPVTLCKGLIGLMYKVGGGSIVNLSGGGATSPRANFTAYATAKTGLVRFSETLALEVRSRNIRVNCISPGAMKTALLEEVVSSGEGVAGKKEFSIASKVFLEGGASMDKVADLVFFLAGNAAQKISGKLISAVWDNWDVWPEHINELDQSDVYTLRRINGRERNMAWGDK